MKTPEAASGGAGAEDTKTAGRPALCRERDMGARPVAAPPEAKFTSAVVGTQI